MSGLIWTRVRDSRQNALENEPLALGTAQQPAAYQLIHSRSDAAQRGLDDLLARALLHRLLGPFAQGLVAQARLHAHLTGGDIHARADSQISLHRHARAARQHIELFGGEVDPVHAATR